MTTEREQQEIDQFKYDTGHTTQCNEYWDRGLQCQCVKPWDQAAVRAFQRGEIDDLDIGP